MIDFKFHHFGYLVKDINKSLKIFYILGFKIKKDICFDNDRLIKICFIQKDNIVLELIEPDKKSTLFSLLKENKNKIYHSCFEVDNMENAVNFLKNIGFILFKDSSRALAIQDNAQVSFLIHNDFGMIELVNFN